MAGCGIGFPADAGALLDIVNRKLPVIPAKAGIQTVFPLRLRQPVYDAYGIKWVPAFAGTTREERVGNENWVRFVTFFMTSLKTKAF